MSGHNAKKINDDLTIFVHVNRIWSCRFRLRIRINLPRPKFANVIRARTSSTIRRTCKTQFLMFLCLCFVEELLVAFESLRGSTTDNGSDRTPLCRHEFRKVEEFFVLFLLFFFLQRRTFKRRMRFSLTFDHSVFLMEGSSHSYQRALHCFGVFLTSREDIRALWSV